MEKIVKSFSEFVNEGKRRSSRRSGKRLNESSYETFMIDYGRDLRDSLRDLKDTLKRTPSSVKEDDNFWASLERSMSRYDKPLGDAVEHIVSSSLYNDSFYFSIEDETREFAGIALDNMNRYGTEMQMCINAIQDAIGCLSRAAR